jgi:hypothetical protein
MPIWVFVYVMYTVSIANPALAQTSALEIGLQQLEAARTGRSVERYQAAEETFTTLLDENPRDPRALIHRGEARIGRGVLLLGRALDTALELFKSGTSDMDRAVLLAPDELRVRLTRGLYYMEFPSSYGKRDVARADLEFSVVHPMFNALPARVRERVLKGLESVLVDGTASEEGAHK